MVMTMRMFDNAFVGDVSDLYDETMACVRNPYSAEVRHQVGLYACVKCSKHIEDDGSISFLDLAGQRVRAYKSGKVEITPDGSDEYFAKDGMELFRRNQLGKDNGYVYVQLYVCPDDPEHRWNCGVHSIVAMCYMIEEFEMVCDDTSWSKRVVVNHMNNAGWDNSTDNIEWCTARQNTAHGHLVQALYASVFGEKYCDKVVTFDSQGTGRRTPHIILKGGLKISVQEIDDSLSYLANKLGRKLDSAD